MGAFVGAISPEKWLCAPYKGKPNDNTNRTANARQNENDRHGLVAPPLVPSGNGSPSHHGRLPPVATAVDQRSAGRVSWRNKGPDLDFRLFEVRQHCYPPNQPRRPRRRARPGVPRHLLVPGERRGRPGVRGNTGNTQQSIGGRRNNPSLPDDPR